MSTKTTLMKMTCPAVTDDVQSTISALAANFNIIDALYPIGTIYQSTKSTNPSTFIGGTWTAIQNKFLVGAGSDFAEGTTGGQKTMGVHKSGDEADGYGLSQVAGFANRVMVASQDYSGKILPPYKAVYMWERTA